MTASVITSASTASSSLGAGCSLVNLTTTTLAGVKHPPTKCRTARETNPWTPVPPARKVGCWSWRRFSRCRAVPQDEPGSSLSTHRRGRSCTQNSTPAKLRSASRGDGTSADAESSGSASFNTHFQAPWGCPSPESGCGARANLTPSAYATPLSDAAMGNNAHSSRRGLVQCSCIQHAQVHPF